MNQKFIKLLSSTFYYYHLPGIRANCDQFPSIFLQSTLFIVCSEGRKIGGLYFIRGGAGGDQVHVEWKLAAMKWVEQERNIIHHNRMGFINVKYSSYSTSSSVHSSLVYSNNNISYGSYCVIDQHHLHNRHLVM